MAEGQETTASHPLVGCVRTIIAATSSRQHMATPCVPTPRNANCQPSTFTPHEAAKCLANHRLIFIGDSTLQEIVLELVSFLLSATPDEFPNADRSHVHTVFDFGADWAVEDCLELSLGRVQHQEQRRTKSSICPNALGCKRCLDTRQRPVGIQSLIRDALWCPRADHRRISTATDQGWLRALSRLADGHVTFANHAFQVRQAV